MERRNTAGIRISRRLGGVVLGCVLILSYAQAQSLSHIPANPNVEENITFTFHPNATLTESVYWDFGNGDFRQSEWGIPTMVYAYPSAGTYHVWAQTETCGSASIHVTIQERRRIEYSPATPVTGTPVDFQTVNFLSSSVRWDFGDGTNRAGSNMDTHTYSAPGLYTVQAVDLGGNSSYSFQAQVHVQMSERSITVSPARPRINETVTFQAVNLSSKTTIRWDFGDGTVQSGPPPTIPHIYRNPGTYLVRAYEDVRTGAATASVQVRVYGLPTISHEPELFRIGEFVTFRANEFFSTTTIRWDFGDGTIQSGPPPTITHIYRNPGTYLVQAYDDVRTGAVTASVTVRAYPPPSLTFRPEDPRPGEPVTFRAVDFFSTSLIRWDFGDGTIVSDTTPPEVVHAYRNPGIYLIRAFDGGGAEVTSSRTLQVLPNRIITVSPPQPRVGEPVLLRAINFLSPRILWNMGDGTPPFEGGPEVSHIFTREGNIQVAAGDFRDGRIVETVVPLSVFPREGPRSLFTISFISLRFSDGKAYSVVPKDTRGLQVFAEIKYEGTGILIAQWLVNGMPFQMVSQALPFADSIIIDSGQIPGLPALIPGLHEVSLAVFQPDVEFPIPAVRYFVTVDPASIQLPEIDLSLSGAKNLEGEILPADAERIEAPAEEHFLLQGTVRNEDDTDIAFVLLRIHLDEKLVDQKLLKELKAGEQRSFESSVFNGSGTAKSVFLTLYDISSSPPRILSIREIKIVTRDKMP